MFMGNRTPVINGELRLNWRSDGRAHTHLEHAGEQHGNRCEI